MVNKQELDAIHAPVEDIKVPASLKFLVIFMALCLLALVAALVWVVVSSGNFAPLLSPSP